MTDVHNLAEPTEFISFPQMASHARNKVSAYVNAALRALAFVRSRIQAATMTVETIKEAVASSGSRAHAVISMSL
jgi:hypothetical protein